MRWGVTIAILLLALSASGKQSTQNTAPKIGHCSVEGYDAKDKQPTLLRCRVENGSLIYFERRKW